jgi:hypothetical protein
MTAQLLTVASMVLPAVLTTGRARTRVRNRSRTPRLLATGLAGPLAFVLRRT